MKDEFNSNFPDLKKLKVVIGGCSYKWTELHPNLQSKLKIEYNGENENSEVDINLLEKQVKFYNLKKEFEVSKLEKEVREYSKKDISIKSSNLLMKVFVILITVIMIKSFLPI